MKRTKTNRLTPSLKPRYGRARARASSELGASLGGTSARRGTLLHIGVFLGVAPEVVLDRTRCVDKVTVGAEQRPERHQVLVERVVVGPLEAQLADVSDVVRDPRTGTQGRGAALSAPRGATVRVG